MKLLPDGLERVRASYALENYLQQNLKARRRTTVSLCRPASNFDGAEQMLT